MPELDSSLHGRAFRLGPRSEAVGAHLDELRTAVRLSPPPCRSFVGVSQGFGSLPPKEGGDENGAEHDKGGSDGEAEGEAPSVAARSGSVESATASLRRAASETSTAKPTAPPTC
jgi:hypothetical protein